MLCISWCAVLRLPLVFLVFCKEQLIVQFCYLPKLLFARNGQSQIILVLRNVSAKLILGDYNISSRQNIENYKKHTSQTTAGDLGCAHTIWRRSWPKTNDSNEKYTQLQTLYLFVYLFFLWLLSAGSCEAGSHADVTNHGRCTQCPFGTYQPEKWQEQCLPCPAGFTTYQRGAASKDLCLRQFSFTTLFYITKADVKILGDSILWVPAGSPSRGGDVTVYVCDMNQTSLPTPFYSVIASIFVFMALSTVFHSMNSPDNSAFSHSVLPVLSLPYWSFQLYVSLWKSPSALI